MADSTLDPDYLTGGRDRSLGRGHGTDALGPSDLSDTGSDMQGAGLARDVGLGMDEGTTSDPDRSTAGGRRRWSSSGSGLDRAEGSGRSTARTSVRRRQQCRRCARFRRRRSCCASRRGGRSGRERCVPCVELLP